MSEPALIGAYHQARRQFADKKFARDTQRARLEWMRAKAFVGISGGVTERRMAVDVSEELARKGQEVREMTHDLDLLKVDVDTIAIAFGCVGHRCRRIYKSKRQRRTIRSPGALDRRVSQVERTPALARIDSPASK